MINKNFSSKTEFVIKTLEITVLGGISMNINGLNTQTDLEDPLLPEWAIADIEGVVATLEEMDALVVHFEISPIQTIGHINVLNGVTHWKGDFPDVFTNLDQLYEEYIAGLVEIIENPPQEISEAEKDYTRDRLNDFGYNIPEKAFKIDPTQHLLED
jgi:hypothetical protein